MSVDGICSRHSSSSGDSLTSNPAFLVALILGTAMLASVCFVYVRNQSFGLGGVIMSGLGVVLVGMSVWKSIDISLSDKGVTAKLEQVEAQAKRAEENASKAKAEVAETAKNVTRLEQSFMGVQAQQKLKDLGMYNGPADGLQGPATRAAISRFQQSKNLPETGELDDATTKSLGIRTTPP